MKLFHRGIAPRLELEGVTPAFYVEHSSRGDFLLRDSQGSEVDRYRSQICADFHCRALLDGSEIIAPHRPLGCRVEVRS